MGKRHQRTVSGFLNDKLNQPAQILKLFLWHFCTFPGLSLAAVLANPGPPDGTFPKPSLILLVKSSAERVCGTGRRVTGGTVCPSRLSGPIGLVEPGHSDSRLPSVVRADLQLWRAASRRRAEESSQHHPIPMKLQSLLCSSQCCVFVFHLAGTICF